MWIWVTDGSPGSYFWSSLPFSLWTLHPLCYFKEDRVGFPWLRETLGLSQCFILALGVLEHSPLPSFFNKFFQDKMCSHTPIYFLGSPYSLVVLRVYFYICAQGLLLLKLRAPYRMSGIEPKLSTGKARQVP